MVDLHLLHFQVFLLYFQLFLLYIQMIYHLKHYHQHHQFCLYNNSINFLMSYSNFDCILYIRMTISRSSALHTNVLLIFETYDLNGALFLNGRSFSALSFSFTAAAKRSIVSFTTIHASL